MSVHEYDMKQFKELAMGTLLPFLIIAFMHFKYDAILPVRGAAPRRLPLFDRLLPIIRPAFAHCSTALKRTRAHAPRAATDGAPGRWSRPRS